MSVGVALLYRHSGAPSAECCLRGKQHAAQRRAELGFWLVATARPEASRSLEDATSLIGEAHSGGSS